MTVGQFVSAAQTKFSSCDFVGKFEVNDRWKLVRDSREL